MHLRRSFEKLILNLCHEACAVQEKHPFGSALDQKDASIFLSPLVAGNFNKTSSCLYGEDFWIVK